MRTGLGRGKLRKRRRRDGVTVWQGDWCDAQGKRRRVDLAEKRADADQMLSAIIRERDLELSGTHAARGLSMSLSDVAGRYLANMRTRAKPGSVANVEASLLLLARELRVRSVRDLTPDVVIEWRDRRVAAGASNKTANNDVAALHAALQFLVRSRLLKSNPIAGIVALPIGAAHQRRRARPLAEWEIARLLTQASLADRKAAFVAGRAEVVPLEPLLRALLLTAARWGELTRATWSDLDVERQTLTLREETTKSGKARTIPLDAALLVAILKLPKQVGRATGRRPGPGDRIFTTRSGAAWSSSKHFGRWLDRLYRAAGIPKRDANGRVVHVHALRHSAATRMHLSGAPIAVVQKYLGHSTPHMTQRTYITAEVEDVRRAIVALPTLPTADVEQSPDAIPNSAQA